MVSERARNSSAPCSEAVGPAFDLAGYDQCGGCPTLRAPYAKGGNHELSALRFILGRSDGTPGDWLSCGSACGPVIVPVFKTGERQAILSLVGSTPTRFRQDSIVTGVHIFHSP